MVVHCCCILIGELWSHHVGEVNDFAAPVFARSVFGARYRAPFQCGVRLYILADALFIRRGIVGSVAISYRATSSDQIILLKRFIGQIYGDRSEKNDQNDRAGNFPAYEEKFPAQPVQVISDQVIETLHLLGMAN